MDKQSASLFKDNNDDSENELKINKDYATNYNNWREKEELNKLKTKYGTDCIDNISNSSSSEEEDDDPDTYLDKEFLKTLSALKNKDPKIYNSNVRFFESNNLPEESLKKKQKTNKPVTLRDFERKIILEREGKFSDNEEEALDLKRIKSNDLTYVEEQQQLKESFKTALNDDDDDDPDLLKPKKQSKEEEQKSEEDYKKWLKEETELEPLRNYWENPNLDPNEKFLKNLILDKKYLNYESSDDEKYDLDKDADLSEEEKIVAEQDNFEHKYNFRFEEPDEEFIKRYPRTIECSMRKKDTRRAEHRANVKKRKEEEKLKRQEELKQLKALKRKEIEEKILKLQEITGNDDIKFNDTDFDADFDPEEHDRKMREMFDDNYYSVANDEAKPEFPDIDEELDIYTTWDDYDPSSKTHTENEPHCEDPDFNMDADYDTSNNVSKEITESKKKRRRRRGKFAEIISKPKPVFEPEKYKSYQEYYDQYYALDYEDMIAGELPCRFKYRKVVPNDYGLTTEEILMADERDLNKWCSLKKALEYKTEEEELQEVQRYRQKSKNLNAKKKILSSLFTPMPEPESISNEDRPSTSNQNQNNSAADYTKKERSTSRKEQQLENKTETIKEELSHQQSFNISNNSVDNKKTKGKKDKKRKLESEPESAPDIKIRKKKDNDKQNEETNHKTNSFVEIKKGTSKENDSEADKQNKQNSKTKKKQKDNSRKRKNLHSKANQEINSLLSIHDERLKSFGINSKKFKNKLKYGKGTKTDSNN